MRFIEIALMSLPGVVLLAWVLGARLTRLRTVAALACGLAVLGVLLLWMGDRRGFTGHYTPARLQNGLVVPSQGS